MSNVETNPSEVICKAQEDAAAVRILEPRDVPLGGLRAMPVRRTLPQRGHTLIGPWCFVDHYGPDDVSVTGGMNVNRHPHTGLATVSWLFTGSIDHLDSAGNSAKVLPGEANVMIAGKGITHSEFSTPETTILHGAQLWFALPDKLRQMAPEFHHFVPEPRISDAGELRVFMGELDGVISTMELPLDIAGAELSLNPGAEMSLELNPDYEYGILVDTGSLTVNDARVARSELAYLSPGKEKMTLRAGSQTTRILVLGGPPFGEEIVMWWNFIGRTHDEVVSYRERYQAEVGAEGEFPSDGQEIFGPFPEGQPPALPAPQMPSLRLRPRGNR